MSGQRVPGGVVHKLPADLRKGLIANARRVGAAMRDGLRALAQKHEVIGDVRGAGLFLGIDLVRDRETREPATEQADYVVNRLRDCGIARAGTRQQPQEAAAGAECRPAQAHRTLRVESNMGC